MFQLLLVSAAVLAIIVSFGYMAIKGPWSKDRRSAQVIVTNGILLVLTGVFFWFVFPIQANAIFYQGIILHIFYLIPIIILVATVFFTWPYIEPIFVEYSYSRRESPKSRIGVIYGAAGLIVSILLMVFIYTGSRWQTCETFPVKEKDSVVEVNPDAIRFTPLNVAYQKEVGKFKSSEFTVEEDLIQPLDLDKGFGYVTQITPEGFINVFSKKNPGFIVYNDNSNVGEESRYERTDQRFEIGDEMWWLDNIYRHLYAADMFCVYEGIHYLQLDPENPRKFTAVAPKIKYRYKFPFFLIPYWGGVTLVHDDGRVEELGPEQTMKDKRLEGKWIRPMELAYEYTDVQIYDRGYLSGWYKREGKIEIPTLPGDNPQPFLFRGKDNHTYFLVSTEPVGQSFGMFRNYYYDSYSGEFVYTEFSGQSLLGPASALERVYGLKGYRWVGEGETKEEEMKGKFRVIEPVYVTKNVGGKTKIYWKYTITTYKYKTISATAIVDPATEEVMEFKTRMEFETWFGTASTFVPTQAGESDGSIEAEINALKALFTESHRLQEQGMERLNRLLKKIPAK